MDTTRQVQTVFHLTGRPPAAPLEPIGELGLRPALLARYRDLGRLRYDFPLVLVDPAEGGPVARSLTGIVNALAGELAPAGPTGEALRKYLLHVERDIRRALTGGATGRLSELWDQAVARLTGNGDEDEPLGQVLAQAGATIPVDGEVVDCDDHLPGRLFAHAWRVVQRERLGRVRADLDGLIVRLNDILRADFVGSAAGRRPDSLKAAVGTRQQGLFDFEVMARLLAAGASGGGLPAARRERIEWALSVLRSQRFFPGALATGEPPHEYAFDTCRGVLQAFRERLPEMAGLVKAMSLAELESEGRYDESRHDAYFDAFDADALSPEDMQIFPDYFVRLRGRPADAAADTNLMQLLSSGIAVKVLVETDDILEEATAGQGRFAFGVRSIQLASLAIGLNDAFVLQSTHSNLLQLREGIRRGMSVRAPALFSVYTATGASPAGLPPYLVSAAAMQSRAFPAFVYDPSAGPDLASRFSLEDNPQPERDWPVANFEYADGALQRVSEPLAFTLADFVAADPRYAHHFARVPHANWNASMVPVAEWLAGPPVDGQVPCLPAVDGDDVLQHLVVDDRLVQAARRCLENWHRLQELGGIRSSHAERLLARERAAWEEEKRSELESLAGAAGTKAAAPAAALPVELAAAAPVDEEEPTRSPDEAWIETIRCSSCNECTQINDRMFAYDDNQQAYIKDLSAGTYRQMIEAAESCQLSIIHPGKPFNPVEAGVEELLERARPFL
jgi:ferredoxin